jgi:predicted lipid-binding transport protein (Tim44 family)
MLLHNNKRRIQMKKLLLVIMSSLLIFAIVLPTDADARGRSYRSPSGSFKQPTKPATSKDNISKTKPTTPAGAATGNRGFFSGGSLMRGIMIGGIAGMLFGGMFGNMGALGNIFGFLINVLAIYFLFVIIRNIVVYFIQRRKTNDKRY